MSKPLAQEEEKEPPRTYHMLLVGYYIAAGIYWLAFALYDITLVPNYLLATLSLASGIGLYTKKKWSLWLGLASIPLMFAASWATLDYSVAVLGFASGIQALAFHVSLVAFMISSVMACILFVPVRRLFKPSAEVKPKSSGA